VTEFVATPTQWDFMQSEAYVRVLAGPVGCLHGDTEVVTEYGPLPISRIDRPMRVLSWNEKTGRFEMALSGGAFPKGADYLYRVSTPQGGFDAAGFHQLLCADGTYRPVESFAHGQSVRQCCSDLLGSNVAGFPLSSHADDLRLTEKAVDSLACYAESARLRGRLLHLYGGNGQVSSPSPDDVRRHYAYAGAGGLLERAPAHTRPGQQIGQLYIGDCSRSAAPLLSAVVGCGASSADVRTVGLVRRFLQFPLSFVRRLRRRLQAGRSCSHAYSTPEWSNASISVSRKDIKETYWDLQVLDTNNYVTVDGTIHHNSGKSVCCCHDLVSLALQQEPNAQGQRKSRALIVRNTADQLAKTVRKTFFAWFPPGVWGAWKESEKSYYIKQPLSDGTTLDFEVWFMPLDTPQDVQRALSLEITFLYGNEWRELHPDVVDGLLARLKRYPSGADGTPTRSCALFDTNMPDMDTWHQEKMDEPPSNWSIHIQPPAILSRDEWLSRRNEEPDGEPVEGYDDTKWWINPDADNVANLDPTYYIDIIPGKSQDYVDVYLRCRYGRSLSGVPVYDKTFDYDVHVAKKPYLPLRSEAYPVIIGLDFGRTPAAVLMQRNVTGQVVVLAELTSENMSIDTFLDRKLRPMLAQGRWAGCTFVVAADPAGWDKQQVGEITPIDVVKMAGFQVAKPASNRIDPRIGAVERLLSSNIGGKQVFQINPECRVVIQGFRHGYRYELNRKGQASAKPEKNEFSHSADACQYACMVIEGNQLRGTAFGKPQRREVKRVNYVWS